LYAPFESPIVEYQIRIEDLPSAQIGGDYSQGKDQL
jgi:hypothetical protein